MVFVACNKEEETLNPKLDETMINFQNLEVGQTNYYLRYVGEKYYDEDSNNQFSYTNDTLKVEIIEEVSPGQFLVEESYTPGSEILEGENVDYYRMVLSYYLSIENDQIMIKKTSDDSYGAHFIYSFSLTGWGSENDGIELPLETFTDKETSIVGWKTTTTYSELFGEYYANNVTIRNFNFGTANVIINNLPMQVDGNGMTYVYNRDYGLIRSFTYSAWTGGGSGWDLIVEN
jgi:hypothetical protein